MIRRPGGPRDATGASWLPRPPRSTNPLLLVAVPPTGPADHLVRFASGMAESGGGRLLLATAVSLPRITPYAAADALLGARSERLGRIRERGPKGLELAHVVVVAHRVAAGLAALARQRGADLMIVGWPRGSDGGAGSWASSSAREIVKRAPCDVCVVERTPASPPDLVVVSTDSGRETELGLSVAGAMLSCVPSPSTRGGGERRGGTSDAAGSASWPAVEPDPGFDARVAVIAVSDPLPSADDRTSAERATVLGADVLVAGALRTRGVWPLRRTVLRTDLADFFSGPVALVHARGPVREPRDARRRSHGR